MKKTIHPKIASSLAGLVYYIFLIFLEIFTGIPFFTGYFKFVISIGIPIVFFTYYKYAKIYDKKNNNDKVFIFIEILLLLIALFLGILFSLLK